MKRYDLFAKVPASLFSPLAAQGATLYSEVLLVLFEETQRHQEPLSRELCVLLIADLLDAPNALEVTADLSEEDDVQEADRVRARAGAVLRYLTRCQWLHAELQENFTWFYTLPDYAFRLLSTLHDIATDLRDPLQGIICSIHDLLQAAARNTENRALRIAQAYRETMRLRNGLKELQHNIGTYIEAVLHETSPRTLLERTFSSYLAERARRMYHALRTTDHVSRFRPGIEEALSQLRRAELRLVQDPSAASGEEPSELAHGNHQIEDHLHTIFAIFDSLDGLLDAIDARHSQFFDAAVRTIELQLTAESTTSGHLHTLLTHLLTHHTLPENDSTRTEECGDNEPLSPINLFTLTLLEEASLASPCRTARPFHPTSYLPPPLSEEQVAAVQDATLAQLNRTLSRRKIQWFAATCLNVRPEIHSSEIPLEGPDDIPLLIYLRAYGDGSLGYVAEEISDAPWIEQAGIGFHDFLLRRNGELAPPALTP